ncbi:hypothetical protein AHAS_Ahas19G0100200 [Arachis hypogaea]
MLLKFCSDIAIGRDWMLLLSGLDILAEIDEIGFRFLRLVPNWSVKQSIMVHLAKSYQVKLRTFILDIGNIRLNAELIGKETVLQKRNLDSFREVPTVSYVGLGPHFGDDSRFFDKIAAFMQKWLYAFEIAQKRLWVLDSMNTGEPNNERLKIHAYAGRIIEDMAKVSMPSYEHTENGLPRFYPSVPQQHNGCDGGVFIIKFMQFWSLDKPL